MDFINKIINSEYIQEISWIITHYIILNSIFIIYFFYLIKKINSKIDKNNKENNINLLDFYTNINELIEENKHTFEEDISNIVKKEFIKNLEDEKNKNAQLKLDLEIELQKYNNSYSKNIIHKGKGAFFKTRETNNHLFVNLEPKVEFSGYRKNDILFFQGGGSCQYKTHLFILVNSVNNGSIESYEWTFGNKKHQSNMTKRIPTEYLFGEYSGYAVYIGRKKHNSNEIILANNILDQFTLRKCWFNNDYLENTLFPMLITEWSLYHY